MSPNELGLREDFEIFFAVIALAFDGSERSTDEAFDGAVDGHSEVLVAAQDLARVQTCRDDDRSDGIIVVVAMMQ